jgi:biotin synthase
MKVRNNWHKQEIEALFLLSFNDLVFKAQQTHRQFFNPNQVQASTLLSIKTGGCAEDCKYCPQSAKYNTGLKADKLMDSHKIVEFAKKAKENGATRFCMGGAWRSPKDKDIEKLSQVIVEIKGLGLETCMTLGMLTQNQAQKLSDSGLDYYNHNLDTSKEFYSEIITTRTYDDRLDTLENVRKAGMKVCCGGILGMGEAREDRISMLQTLANLPKQPESVPINMLVAVKGTPLENQARLDIFEFIRTIAVARILMPKSYIRLSAGREEMSEETQALAFLCGANSIFYGEKLLTTKNPEKNQDLNLLNKLGIEIEGASKTEFSMEDFLSKISNEPDEEAEHLECGGGCRH